MDLIAGAGPSRLVYRMLMLLVGVGGGIGLGFLIASLLGSSPAGAATAPAPVVAGQFTSVPPARLVNTATGAGGHTGALGSGQTMTVQVTGHGNVPAAAKAVNVMLTASAGSSASGRLTVFPAATTRPTVPSLYFAKGQTVSVNLTVPLGSGGKLSIYNASGKLTVFLDVYGYNAPDPTISTLQSQLSTLQSQLSTLQTQQATDESHISALQTLLSGVSRTTHNGYDTLLLSGINVQIVNGSGNETTTNGLGNLIVGYDANPNSAPRTGSHNLIVGDGHEWTSYGGLVAGTLNTISAPYATVLAGEHNVASGTESTVSGGWNNTASQTGSTVSGGYNNTASGSLSAVSGGITNTATSPESVVSGGYTNTASGDAAIVSGGEGNTASGSFAVVSGGEGNTASGNYAVVSGGEGNTASGNFAVASGGEGNAASGSCQAIPAAPISAC